MAYHPPDSAVVAVTPKRESNWWRDVLPPGSVGCGCAVRNGPLRGRGPGDDRESLLAAYFASHGLLVRVLGVCALVEQRR